MEAWKTCLKADPTDWLLQSDDPSLRYFTARDLLGIHGGDLEPYRQAVKGSSLIERILSHQQPGGHWGKPEDFYEHSKYKGTVWSVILLAELGADPADERVHKAGNFLLQNSQDPITGGFGYMPVQYVAQPEWIIPCLSGNLAWSLLRLGFMDDPRLRKALDWISTVQRFDDHAPTAPSGTAYVRERCWGRHTCALGAIKALKALSALPVEQRTAADEACIASGIEFFLQHRVFLRSRNPARPVKEGWLSFGFPRMYETDALEILDILLSLGCRDPRMQDAVDLVLSKQGSDGAWLMDHSWNGRMLVRIEKEGEPSRWVTYQALKALKAWFSPLDPAFTG
jgi:hypothetical protein